jgi:hypothetical protein
VVDGPRGCVQLARPESDACPCAPTNRATNRARNERRPTVTQSARQFVLHCSNFIWSGRRDSNSRDQLGSDTDQGSHTAGFALWRRRSWRVPLLLGRSRLRVCAALGTRGARLRGLSTRADGARDVPRRVPLGLSTIKGARTTWPRASRRQGWQSRAHLDSRLGAEDRVKCSDAPRFA